MKKIKKIEKKTKSVKVSDNNTVTVLDVTMESLIDKTNELIEITNKIIEILEKKE
jgi:hypothetical protein